MTKPDQKTAYLILLDVPEGTEIGIDWKYWNVGPRFRGIKQIPHGTHFIYYSSVNRGGDTGPRTGFFYSFFAGEFLVKQWNGETEDLDDKNLLDDEKERYLTNLEELESHLGPYPMENYKTWVSLSNWIDAGTLAALTPLAGAGRVTSVAQFHSEGSTSADRLSRLRGAGGGETTTASSSLLPDPVPVDADGLPELCVVKDSLPRFTQVPDRPLFPTTPPAAAVEAALTASEVSRHSMDRTYTLDRLLGQRFPSEGSEDQCAAFLLGELQYAFVCFVLGNLMDGFEQWRRLVDLVCRCEQAISRHPALYTALVSLLYHQIQVIPQDLFTDIVTGNNFLVASLHSLFRNIEEAAAVSLPGTTTALSSLRSRCVGLRCFLKRRFGWEFTGELEDELPVVVVSEEMSAVIWDDGSG